MVTFHIDLIASHKPGYAVRFPSLIAANRGMWVAFDPIIAIDADCCALFFLPLLQNVSVIDLSTNTAIGEPLKSWDLWPDDVTGGGDDSMGTPPPSTFTLTSTINKRGLVRSGMDVLTYFCVAKSTLTSRFPTLSTRRVLLGASALSNGSGSREATPKRTRVAWTFILQAMCLWQRNRRELWARGDVYIIMCAGQWAGISYMYMIWV